MKEVLQPATHKGAFDLEHPNSLRSALDEVLAMPPDEVHSCGLILRDEYHSAKVVDKMVQVFQSVAKQAT